MRNSLIILGGARCVWDDYNDAPSKGNDIMAVGHVGLFCPEPIKYIASMHREVLPSLQELRWHICRIRWHRAERPETHGWSGVEFFGVDKSWYDNDFPVSPRGGSSGMFAALIGLYLGYDEIVLCGCPADETGNFYDVDCVNDDFRNKRKVWTGVPRKKIRSMSGWTRDHFGAP